MAVGWFGWAQEDPKPRLRPFLGTGTVLGLLLSITFGILVARDWRTPTALEGRCRVFGVVVPVLRRGEDATSRWVCPWIGD